ncbi:MAG: leucyl aminopeptidase [Desulfobacteraceae bacterium]|jgi:leucyl aminopeptidase
MLTFCTAKPSETNSELLAIPVYEDFLLFKDPAVTKIVKNAKKLVEFSGKKNDEVTFYEPSGILSQRVLFIGLGKQKKVDAESFRQFAGRAVRNALNKNLNLDILVPEKRQPHIEKSLQIKSILEGAELANHTYETYKSDKHKTKIENIRLIVSSADTKKYKYLLDQVNAICRATHQAREWVNMPSNDKPPLVFADMIAKLARKSELNYTFINEKELSEKQFGAMLAVASGSDNHPCLLILEYTPQQAQKCVALVGKGVTFDSGGINLKPSSGMGDMKADMAGAAAVAATLLAVAELKPDISVIGVLPLVENLPSGSAYRPGDVVRAYNGKTIEIGNTDAEGRLILADAMAYTVDTFKPDIIIDLATLTGACIVALGEKIAGVFSSDDTLAKTITQAGQNTHERCWRLPIPEDYKDNIKSDIADIRNVGQNRWGGAISAALFLSEFVVNTRWAHIDIAGPAFGKKSNSYTPAGASGFGVRLLCDFLCQLSTN